MIASERQYASRPRSRIGTASAPRTAGPTTTPSTLDLRPEIIACREGLHGHLIPGLRGLAPPSNYSISFGDSRNRTEFQWSDSGSANRRFESSLPSRRHGRATTSDNYSRRDDILMVPAGQNLGVVDACLRIGSAVRVRVHVGEVEVYAEGSAALRCTTRQSL